MPSWADPDDCPAPRTRHDQAAYVRNKRNHEWPWPGMPETFVVPEGHIFMMGDNRYNSMDSRYWGPLDMKLIKGKAMFIYWSWNGEEASAADQPDRRPDPLTPDRSRSRHGPLHPRAFLRLDLFLLPFCADGRARRSRTAAVSSTGS